jgi:colanic acid biosynthesis glycosyl transferase WcaI
MRRLLPLRDKPTLVVISQAYVPDPAAVGQYMHDVARTMVERGQRVIAIGADRGYERPEQRHARYERIDGVHVLRLPLSSFGKRNLTTRLVGGASFVTQATALALALPRIDRVLVSTSPPMCSAAGIALAQLRGARLSFWAMDINPDQIVASGRLSAEALPVQMFDALNRQTLARADRVIALDRFIAERLSAKHVITDKLKIVPLWPLFDPSDCTRSSDNAFRRRHQFGERRVVMYSGNLSPVHPVDSILEAARLLARADDPRLLFVFVGGGLGRERIASYVREHALPNVRMLPYQLLAELPLTLSAADVHLVSMGQDMVGIVHPSKIYGALAAGRPILAVAPERSHVHELVRDHRLGWCVGQADPTAALAALREIADASPAYLAELGERARQVASRNFDRADLLNQLCGFLA